MTARLLEAGFRPELGGEWIDPASGEAVPLRDARYRVRLRFAVRTLAEYGRKTASLSAPFAFWRVSGLGTGSESGWGRRARLRGFGAVGRLLAVTSWPPCA
jgi:hypothetical protein